MVHFPGLARTRLWIQRAVYRFYRYGFPHSEIPGSKPACGSPRLIAASHVLHRLLAPRHPPYALSSLTIKLTRHVAAATCFSRWCRADNSPFSFHNSLSRAELADLNAWRLLQCKRSKTLRVLASFFSCQRASALGTAQSVPRPAERPKILRTEIKNPASSAGPIRPPQANGFARCSTEYYPVFVTGLTSSPRGLDKTHRP